MLGKRTIVLGFALLAILAGVTYALGRVEQRRLNAALLAAIYEGTAEEVRLLLEAGGDPLVRGKDGWAAAERALTLRSPEMLAAFLDAGVDVNAELPNWGSLFSLAAWWGREDQVRFLLDRGADIHARDAEGWTALHTAAGRGRERIVALLLERGADLHAGAAGGWTPLHSAARSVSEEVVALLVERGADLEATNWQGWTPLHAAAERNRLEVAAALLEHGASPNARAADGRTPLHLAAAYRQWSVDGRDLVALLLENGADPNAAAEDGWTPLHAGALAGSPEATRLLLEAGADPNARTADGRTPLAAARERQPPHPAVLELLEAAGGRAGRRTRHLASMARAGVDGICLRRARQRGGGIGRVPGGRRAAAPPRRRAGTGARAGPPGGRKTGRLPSGDAGGRPVQLAPRGTSLPVLSRRPLAGNGRPAKHLAAGAGPPAVPAGGRHPWRAGGEPAAGVARGVRRLLLAVPRRAWRLLGLRGNWCRGHGLGAAGDDGRELGAGALQQPAATAVGSLPLRRRLLAAPAARGEASGALRGACGHRAGSARWGAARRRTSGTGASWKRRTS